jgi:hypothetical protein
MTRKLLTLLSPLALAACLGGSNDEPVAQPLVSHDAFVASLNGAYIWDCSMANNTGQAWRFVLSKSNSTRWTEVILQEAGARFAQDIETETFGEAMIYRLRDQSQVLVASDGEARGEGQQATKPHDFPQGQCTRGNQS